MTIQKKVIISARRGLVEATVCNRNEVVEYLQQHNWHLDRDVFIRVAPPHQEVGTRSRHERHQ